MSVKAEIFFPPFRLDSQNEQLWREEQLIALRPKTFAILRSLAEHPGRLVKKDELVRAVWGEKRVSEEGLRDYLREIRQALGDDATAPRFVATVRGRGYRFLPAVTTAPVQGSKFPVPSLDAQPSARGAQHSVLVGREAELAQMHGWLEQAVNGERQLIFVTGEPGIGKTALVDTFLAAVGAQSPAPGGEQVWIGHGQCIEVHGAGEAFLPMLDALGRIARGPAGASVIELLRRHAPMWLVQLPAFIESEELETLQRQVQGASRERMLREFAALAEALTTGGTPGGAPLLLVLEDLHWSDVSTLDLLAFMAWRREFARLLIIGTYRPVEMLSEGHPLKGVVHELYAHQLAREWPLGLLSAADVEAYLDNRLGGEARRTAPLIICRLENERNRGTATKRARLPLSWRCILSRGETITRRFIFLSRQHRRRFGVQPTKRRSDVVRALRRECSWRSCIG
jgi:DNA-binding winged helix-turn-helix (wHTH) protein